MKIESLLSKNDLKNLIEKAKTEKSIKNIKSQKALTNDSSFEYFIKNYKDDLTYYKQEKHSGFEYIVLYKGVRIANFDFRHPNSNAIKELIEVKEWEVHCLETLKRNILKKFFENPWDNRRLSKYKPSGEKIWNIIEEIII